jgi:hypothetical protein
MQSIIGNNRRNVSARWNWKMNVNQALGLYSIMPGAREWGVRSPKIQVRSQTVRTQNAGFNSVL